MQHFHNVLCLGKAKGMDIDMENTKHVTMKDVAKSLNVSVTTISKVVNGHKDISGKTKDEVWAKINEMGYTPNFLAANLRRNNSNVVALVLSDISKPYFSKVIQGYEEVLNTAGYHMMVFSSMEQSKKEESLLNQIASMNIAGIIIDPAQNSDIEKKTLKGTGIPYVFSNRFLDSEKDFYVAADNEKAGYIATRHLLERKPGKPVYIVNTPDNISPTIDRFKGYCKAMEEANMPILNHCIFSNNFSLEDAYRAGTSIAKEIQGECSVFCSTDQLAIGVMRALLDSGIAVPSQVGVIGVDDIDVSAYLSPALTTVALPKKSIGQKSAEMLIKLIEGQKIDEYQILLDPELIVRATT